MMLATMKKILIIDDDYAIRELLALTLESGYEILKLENGKMALDFIKEQKPDLIILDIMMPGIDGFEVCRQIKEDELTRKIPVIILTAKHQVEDLKAAIKADVDEFITKPFEPDMLLKRVAENLQGIRKDPAKKLFQDGKSLHYIRELRA